MGMRTSAVLVLALGVFCATVAQGQRSRGGGGRGGNVTALPAKDLVITVHGTLKELNKNSIVLESTDNQIQMLRRTSKTKFFLKDKEIKGDDIVMESVVAVDATEDTDMKLMAVAVRVEKMAEKERELKKRN